MKLLHGSTLFLVLSGILFLSTAAYASSEECSSDITYRTAPGKFYCEDLVVCCPIAGTGARHRDCQRCSLCLDQETGEYFNPYATETDPDACMDFTIIGRFPGGDKAPKGYRPIN